MRARVVRSWGLLATLLGCVAGACRADDEPFTGTSASGGRVGLHAGGGEDDPASRAGASSDGGVSSDGGKSGMTRGDAGNVAEPRGEAGGEPSSGGTPGEPLGAAGAAGEGSVHAGDSVHPGGVWEQTGGAGGDEACPSCHARTVSELALGATHTCVRFLDGTLKCWGKNQAGQLGRGDTIPIGDDERPSAIGSIHLSQEPGVSAAGIVAGAEHNCALLSDGTLKCWGDNSYGQLGYATTNTLGDDEQPADFEPVKLSPDPEVKAYQLAAGDDHNCALLSDDSVKCWGSNAHYALGYPGVAMIGATDTPADWDPLRVTTKAGVKVVQLACGREHSCALLSDQTVTCWGRSSHGQLGYGNHETIGDDEEPSAAGPVSVTNEPGVGVTSLAARAFQTCALLSNGRMKCWGRGTEGELGNQDGEDVGDDELPSDVADWSPLGDAGLAVSQIGTGATHGCALLSNGSIVCWGDSSSGRLGYGSDLGRAEALSLTVRSGVVARRLSTGWNHSCALLSDGSVTCWGAGDGGALGYGNQNPVGDDELPSSAAPVSLFDSP